MSSNQAQTKYLNERLSAARSGFRLTNLRISTKKPKHVIAAEKIVAAWEKSERRADDRVDTKINKAFNKAKQSILFDEPKKALQAVIAFEKMKF